MAISAPLAQPQQNQGANAQAALFAAQMVEIGKKALPLLDVGSPLGQAILEAIKKLSREASNVPHDAIVNSLKSQLQTAQQQQMMRAVAGRLGGAQGAGMLGAPSATAQPAAPATPAPQGAAA